MNQTCTDNPISAAFIAAPWPMALIAVAVIAAVAFLWFLMLRD